MDWHFGRLIDYLQSRNILDESIVIVTSDHGENFLEHPLEFNHGKSVYQTTVQAVGMIRLPGAAKGGTVVNQLFSNIDILPTLLKFMGLGVSPGMEGEAVDLQTQKLIIPPLIRFAEATKPHLKVETEPGWRNSRKTRCIRSGPYKYIETPFNKKTELYDISNDHMERKNLVHLPTPETEKLIASLGKQLTAWSKSANPLPSEMIGATPEVLDDTMRKLKALGYVE
jgi:arylsulfatase A-like enzyme